MQNITPTRSLTNIVNQPIQQNGRYALYDLSTDKISNPKGSSTIQKATYAALETFKLIGKTIANAAIYIYSKIEALLFAAQEINVQENQIDESAQSSSDLTSLPVFNEESSVEYTEEDFDPSIDLLPDPIVLPETQKSWKSTALIISGLTMAGIVGSGYIAKKYFPDSSYGKIVENSLEHITTSNLNDTIASINANYITPAYNGANSTLENVKEIIMSTPEQIKTAYCDYIKLGC